MPSEVRNLFFLPERETSLAGTSVVDEDGEQTCDLS
jgi:hypothetical protein